MISYDTIVLFHMFFLNKERNSPGESDGDKYIKVINDIVNLMAHLYPMKNRLFIYPRLCS